MTSMVRKAADILAQVEASGAQPAPAAAPPVEHPAVLRWENPPPRNPRGQPIHPLPASKYEDLTAELRQRPGVWALVFVGEKVRATRVADAVRLGRRGSDYEAVTRNVDGRTRAYARYIGDQG